ncbi:hypothetical protein DEA98_06795 [Brucella pseudogrignonensis]|nr:hypothetical protein [Brucella pseudogrignonensis]
MNISIPNSIPAEEINGTVYVNKGKGELIALSAIKPEHVLEDGVVRRLPRRLPTSTGSLRHSAPKSLTKLSPIVNCLRKSMASSGAARRAISP